MTTKTQTPKTDDVEVTLVATPGAVETIEKALKDGRTPRLQPEQLQGELMSVKETAEMLGLSLSSVSHHVKTGHLKALTVGTASILLRWSVEQFQTERAAVAETQKEEKELRRKLALLVEQRKAKEGKPAPTKGKAKK